MGAKLSKQWHKNQPKPTPPKADPKPSLTLMEMIKPECLRLNKTKKMKKRRIQTNPDDKNRKNVKKLTLEDWLLESPGPVEFNQCGSEQSVFKQHFSNKVFPGKYDCSEEEVVGSSCYRRVNQSGKMKKKVSFKLPDESDIILFHSPAEKFVSE